METGIVPYRPPLPPPPKKSRDDLRIERERRKTREKAQELEALKTLHKAQTEHQAVQRQLRREKLAPLRQRAQAVATPIKAYGRAAHPYVERAAKEGLRGLGRAAHITGQYIKRVATPPIAIPFTLTLKGRRALTDGSIPRDTIRYRLLSAAHDSGFFSLAGAVSAYGDNGVQAAQLLAEAGLIQRMTR